MVLLDSIPVFALVSIAAALLLAGALWNNFRFGFAAIPVAFLGMALGVTVVFEHTYTVKWGYVAIAASFIFFSVFASVAIQQERRQQPTEASE